MRKTVWRVLYLPIGFAILAAAIITALQAQQRTPRNPAAEWPMYNRDLGGTRFSPLNQINARNVDRLVPAWSYKVGKVRAEGITGGTEVTPIVVNGMMYLPTNNRIVALEPESGKELWSYDAKAEPTRSKAP